MPSRTSLLLSLSATSFLNSALAQHSSPQTNELEAQDQRTLNELLDSVPDGSLHDTLADGVPGFEQTSFSNDREAAQALHDHDPTAAMKMLSMADVDLVRRQILPSVSLPLSVVASLGVSLPTSIGNLLPTAASTETVLSTAPVVASTTQVLPTSTPVDSSTSSPSPLPSSTPTSAAPVPTSTTQGM